MKSLVEERLFDTVQQVTALAEAKRFERVGSMIWWEIKGGIDLSYNDAVGIFKETPLVRFIQPVILIEAINRFAEKVVKCHGRLYGKALEYFTQRLDGYYFLVFYTGKVKAKDDASQFTEHAKFMIGEEGDYLALLNNDKDFLINTFDKAWDLFNGKCWNIINKDIQWALSAFSNAVGYRFNDHGGTYFIPHTHTEQLYKIKNIISNFGQKLAITPIICGCDEDVQEIINIIGAGFQSDLQDAKRQLFEICLKEYGYAQDWELYKEAAKNREIDKLENNRIALKTRYGIELTEKLVTIDANASDTEYAQITKEWIDSIKPNKYTSIPKLYKIVDGLKESIEKLQVAAQSEKVNKYLNKLLEEAYVVNRTIEKISEKIHTDVLSIL